MAFRRCVLRTQRRKLVSGSILALHGPARLRTAQLLRSTLSSSRVTAARQQPAARTSHWLRASAHSWWEPARQLSCTPAVASAQAAAQPRRQGPAKRLEPYKAAVACSNTRAAQADRSNRPDAAQPLRRPQAHRPRPPARTRWTNRQNQMPPRRMRRQNEFSRELPVQ